MVSPRPAASSTDIVTESPTPSPHADPRADQPGGDAPDSPVVCLVDGTDIATFGLTGPERARRAFARAGLHRLLGPHADPPATGRVILLRGDYIVDPALVPDLAARRDYLLCDEAGRPVAASTDAARAPAVRSLLASGSVPPGAAEALGLVQVTAATLGSSYHHKLRKREAPYILNVAELGQRAAEWRMFLGAYKGVTDFVTKYVWPVPALWVTRWCARRGVTPNAVTLVSLVFVFAALALFATGHFALGLAAAWIMTFLDTVDGKLARVTLTSSGAGDALDHGIDLIHPPFWWAAWWYGLNAAGYAGPGAGELALWVVVGGYVAGRLLEGVFLWQFKMESHSWERIDSQFRLIIARRNPNLALLTGFLLAGAPETGFLAVALWTAASLAFQCLRTAQAFRVRRRDGALVSWMARPAAEA